MLNEFIGKYVHIYSGFYSYMTNPDRGIVLDVNEKWLKLETRNNIILLDVNKISKVKTDK